MEHLNYVDFCFVYWFLQYFLQEEEDSSETVLIPTRRNTTDTTDTTDRCNKTLEFGKTHTHLQNLYYYTSGDPSFLPVQTINSQQDMTKSTKITSGSLCNISDLY